MSAAVGATLLAGRLYPGAAIAFMGMGIIPAPWYFFWGFPLAAVGRWAAPFLIAAPLLLSLFTLTYASTPLRTAFHFLAIVLALLRVYTLAVGALRRTRPRPA